MSYKKDDEALDHALLTGHLPGEEDDFFTEDKIKVFFQKVVEREIEENKRMGGSVSGMPDN